MGQRFLNKYQTGQDADSGASRAWSYRADAAQAIRGGLLEQDGRFRDCRLRGAGPITGNH